MSVDLNNFEAVVSDKIRKRGINYYNQDRVLEVQETDKGIWNASVKGSQTYSVEIHLENNRRIEKVGCSCPYNYRLICKHLVAVLYVLKDKLTDSDNEVNGGIPSPEIDLSKVDIKPVNVRRESFSRQLDERLYRLSKQEMRSYLKNILLDEPRLRTEFLLQYPAENEQPDKQYYRRRIRDVLNSVEKEGERYQYNYYSSSLLDYKSMQPITKLLDKAEQYLESEECKHAVCICQAIIEEAVEGDYYIYSMDDPLSMATSEALDLLYSLSESNPDTRCGRNLFTYALKKYQHEEYESLGYDYNFLMLARKLATTDDEYQQLEDLVRVELDALHELGGNRRKDTYRIRQRVQDLIEIYTEQDKTGQATELMERYKDIDGIRKLLIWQIWDRNNYARVKELALEGRQLQDNSSSGTTWLQWLLEVAKAEKDTESQQKYTRKLLLETKQFQWYKELKKLYKEEEWSDISQDIINKFKNGRMTHIRTLASIYNEEERWEDLLALAQARFGLGNLPSFSRPLSQHFHEEWLELYQNLLDDFMHKNTGRKYYRDLCSHLKKIEKLGNKKDAQSIADRMRRRYNNRPAMKEELSKAGY